MAAPQTPPTTPPAMAPVFVVDLPVVDDEVEVGVKAEVAVAVDVDVEVGEGVGVAGGSVVSVVLQEMCAEAKPYSFH